ncbi:MAG TPA: hypothetical protein VIK56_05520 [Rhodoferax sp.]
MNDLTALVQQADVWLHGHVHNSFDYRLGRCRVVANPAGYVKNLGWARSPDEFEFENPLFNLSDFDRNLVVEVDM